MPAASASVIGVSMRRRRTITVAVTKVVRSAKDNFEIRWEERISETGAAVRRERFMGAVGTVFNSPNTIRMMTKSPLGIYVGRFTWRHDSVGDANR